MRLAALASLKKRVVTGRLAEFFPWNDDSDEDCRENVGLGIYGAGSSGSTGSWAPCQTSTIVTVRPSASMM